MNNLIGFIVALGLGLSMLSYVGDTNTDTANLHLARASAEYSKVVSQATQQYITDNYDAVLANATATKPAVITISMLKASNHLPSSISDKNPYGQTYSAYAIKPQAGNLQTMLVSSGGNTISEGQLIQISKMVGSQGGYISQKTPSVVNGTFGGWSMPLSSYQLSSNPGHLATALFFVSGQVSNDYLYRSSVTGHPELNRMNTALDMASNDVNNAGQVNAGTVNTTGETYTGGWFRTTGDGGVYFQKYGGGLRMTDTNTIRTYGGKSIASENDVTAGRNVTAAGTVQGGYVNSTGNIDANGTATAGQVVSKGRVTAGEFLQLNQVAVAGAACSPNGLVGRDSVGGILSCQSGVWKVAGSSSGKYIYLGSYRGDYSGSNSGSGTLFLYVTGGNGGTVGGTCANTSRLQGYVSGQLISANADNSPSYGKIAFISFAVPPGTPYSISSYPTENNPCGKGLFTVYAYQT